MLSFKKINNLKNLIKYCFILTENYFKKYKKVFKKLMLFLIKESPYIHINIITNKTLLTNTY